MRENQDLGIPNPLIAALTRCDFRIAALRKNRGEKQRML